MTKKQIIKWLHDFHEDLENRTDKTYLTLKDLLELMPEECGRAFLDIGNNTFGTDIDYDLVMATPANLRSTLKVRRKEETNETIH